VHARLLRASEDFEETFENRDLHGAGLGWAAVEFTSARSPHSSHRHMPGTCTRVHAAFGARSVVVSIARGYHGYGLPQADLIQEGNIGLMKAVKRFDPERGVRLVSFAVHWIRAEIHEFILRNWRIVKVATTKAQRKLFFNLRSMKQGFGALGSTEANAMARQLGVKPEEVFEMETRLTGQDLALEPVGDDEEEGFAPISYLSDPDLEPGRILEHDETERLRTEGLERALDGLDPRSRRIIQARWLTEGDTATLHDLATEFGVSAERIRQIEQKAMQKMKALMAPAS